MADFLHYLTTLIPMNNNDCKKNKYNNLEPRVLTLQITLIMCGVEQQSQKINSTNNRFELSNLHTNVFYTNDDAPSDFKDSVEAGNQTARINIICR